MGLKHLLTNGFIIAPFERITNCKYTVFLTENKMCTLVILFTNFSSYFFQLLPCAVTKCLKFSLRMLGSNVFHNILTAVTTIVIWASCKFVLYL